MYLTIDIGGTKTLLARMNNKGELKDSLKFPTPKLYENFKKELADNIAKITTTPYKLTCSSAPAKIDHERGVAEAFGNLPWVNIPLRDDIAAITKTKVLLENDTKLAGLSEARLLKPARDKVLYLTFSTGIGSVLITDNRIDQDLQDSEVGFMLFEREGKLVPWQSFASGKAIYRRFGKMAGEIDDPAVWKLIARDFAIGMIDVFANVQPDIAIIGGGVGSHFKKFEKYLLAELRKYESPMVEIPKIIGAKRPEQAVVYGCYELIKDYERSR